MMVASTVHHESYGVDCCQVVWFVWLVEGWSRSKRGRALLGSLRGDWWELSGFLQVPRLLLARLILQGLGGTLSKEPYEDQSGTYWVYSDYLWVI